MLLMDSTKLFKTTFLKAFLLKSPKSRFLKAFKWKSSKTKFLKGIMDLRDGSEDLWWDGRCDFCLGGVAR